MAQYWRGTTGIAEFALPNALASTLGVTTYGGSVFSLKLHNPFGQAWTGYGSSYPDQRFAEMSELEPDGRTYFTLFRRNPANLYRWLSPDPAGLAAADPSNRQSWSRYAYVMNNPVNAIDPQGLFECWDSTIENYCGSPLASGDEVVSGFLFNCAMFQEGADCGYGNPSPYYQNNNGSGGGSGGGAGGSTIASSAKDLALKKILSNLNCLDFILSTIKKGFQIGNGGAPSSHEVGAAEQAASTPVAFAETLSSASIVSGQSFGPAVAAVTSASSNTITTTPLFNTLGTSAQATVLIHETFHLVPYFFTDVQAAAATGWQRPPGVTDLQAGSLASAAFTQTLAQHCGW